MLEDTKLPFIEKPLISVVNIMRNEATQLPKLAESLKEFLDRGGNWVILDTGSADDSISTARSLGAKVYEAGEQFQRTINAELAEQVNKRFIIGDEEPLVRGGDRFFDYSAARNYAATFAEHDMVSMPDCDEIYVNFNIDEINRVINEGYTQIEFQFIFATYPNGQPSVMFRQSKSYNRKVMQWTGIIHEVLTGESKRIYLPPEIFLLKHLQAPQSHRSRYLAGLALDCFQRPGEDRQSHYLGRELYWNCRPRSAIKELRRHVSMNRWQQERGESLVFIGDCHLALGEENKALEAYHEAIDVDGTRRHPWIKLAEYYYRKQDWQRTACYAQAALEIPWTDCYCNIMGHYTFYPHEMLYVALWWLGDKRRSKEHWLKALECDPQNPKYNADRQFYETQLANPLVPNIKERCPENVQELTQRIKDGTPFIFLKCGDGELACMQGSRGQNCDGQSYSPQLGLALFQAFDYAFDAKNAYVVVWKNQEKFNMLLNRRGNNLSQVRDFYKAIRYQQARKVFIGPSRLRDVCDMLRADFIKTPEQEAFSAYDTIQKQLEPLVDSGGILVFSCGSTAKPLITWAQTRNPNITAIDAGSAFDPIFVGQTRTEQFTQEELIEAYRDMLPFSDANLPHVTILLPTLGRPEGLQRCLTSIDKLVYPKSHIKVVVDDGDGTVPQKVNRMARANQDTDCYVYAANDITFDPWCVYRAVWASKDHGLVAFNEGPVLPDAGNICTHFLITQELVNKLGEIFSEKFAHCGCDNLLWAKAKKMGRAARCEDAKITHYHFSKGSPMDSIYQAGWSHVEEDRKTLAAELEALKS